MAFREVTMFEIREVVRQWLRGDGVKTIARSVGADPKTVRRYVRAAQRVGIERSDGVDGLDDERFAGLLEALKMSSRNNMRGNLCARAHEAGGMKPPA